MAKLYFKYGAMGSSKTTRCLTDAYEYESRGNEVLLMKSGLDTRSSIGRIESRTGLSAECLDVSDGEHLMLAIKNAIEKSGVSCVFVDEAQFLSPTQVLQLRNASFLYDIPIICYGLRSDFRGMPFDGSVTLMAIADSIEEVKSICSNKGCTRKATYNARFDSQNNFVFVGEQVVIGDIKESENQFHYKPICTHCYMTELTDYVESGGVLE